MSKNKFSYSKEEKEILYHIFKQKFMIEVRLFSLGYLLSEYKGKFDKEDLEKSLNNLVKWEYLVRIDELRNDPSYGILNKKKYQEIEKLFWKRRFLDWFKDILLRFWRFLWKHFIIAIIVLVVVGLIIDYLT